MANYEEALFQSIELITEQKLKSLQFDKTIEATIVDATKASQGIYTVSNENSSFVAYSSETGYQEDEVVMVNIPQGDYSKQKNIIGRCVNDKSTTPLSYKSPFQQIINLSENLITNENEDTYTMFANDINKSSILIWESDDNSNLDLFKISYTRLGIKADFSTWLKDYNTASGNYGLRAIITFIDRELPLPIENQTFSAVFTFDCKEFLGNVYDFNIFTNQEIVFDISDYVGCEINKIQLYAYQDNNFKNEYNELIYDITDFISYSSNLENITIDVVGFEDPNEQEKYRDNFYNNSYFLDYLTGQVYKGKLTAENYCVWDKNINNGEELILTTEQLNNISINYSLKENILIKNPYICLGVSSDNFSSDSALIYSDYNCKYYKTEKEGKNRKEDNQKNLNLRWVHQDEINNIISVVSDDQIIENYEIRWYRYKLGSPSADQFSGAHWERFYGCKETPDEKEDYGITIDDLNNDNISDIATNKIKNILFYPNINKETEQFKVIIVKKEVLYSGQGETVEHKMAESPILVFSNEEKVRNEANFIDTNALSIRYEDNQKGNYFVYNKARQLFSKEQNILRKLTAVFDTTTDNILDKQKLTTPYTYIKWIFPANQTMIEPVKFDTLNSENPEKLNKSMFPSEDNSNTGERKNYIIINDNSYIYYNENNETYEFFVEVNVQEENEDIQKETLISVGYYINQQLNYNYSNNFVQLEILRDGQIYNTNIQMRFGTSGTSGSDYTLVVDWEDNAFDIHKGELSGQVRLFNQSDEIDLNDIDANCVYSWYKTRQKRIEDINNKSNKSIAENRDIYYPIKNNAFQPIKFLDENNTQINDDSDYYINYGVEPYDTWGNAYPRIKALNEQAPLAYYDLIEKKFHSISWADYSDDKLLYRKLSPEEEKKPEMQFQAIKTVNFTGIVNNRTGAIYYDASNKRVFGHDDYSKKYKLFIKYNDSYIIDPWDSYQEDEIYYEPIYSENKKYSHDNEYLLQVKQDINKKGYFTITDERTVENETTEKTPDIENDLYILQIKLNNFGDYPLIARFPIALKNSSSSNLSTENSLFYINYVEGADSVRYSSSGEKDFDKTIYNIHCCYLDKDIESEEENFKNISNTDKLFGQFEDKEPFGHWELIYDNHLSQDYLLPRLIEMSSKNDNLNNIYYQPSLEPPSIYIDSSFIYGIKFVTDYDITSNYEYIDENNNISNVMIPAGTTLWIQPIYVYQDNYPSTTLNQWGGKGVTIDKENGSIMVNNFSAGRKEVDNTFSGVILGDWSKTDSDIAITKQTGIYGFHHGAMSYALKEDGTAFFGKDGSGRIYFNGNSAKIYSARWLSVSGGDNSSYTYSQNPEGMMLDLDNGVLDTRLNKLRTYLSPGVFQLYGKDNNQNQKILLNISSSDFYLQSANYNNINTGTKINLEDGAITAYNFKLTAGTNPNTITINSDNSQYTQDDTNDNNLIGTYKFKPLTIGSKFSVDWDGSLIASGVNITGTIEATNGHIGGWIITANRIHAPYIPPSQETGGVEYKTAVMARPRSSQDMTYTFAAGGTNTNGYGDCPFRVDKNGKLYSTSLDVGNGKLTYDTTNGLKVEGAIKATSLDLTLLPNNSIPYDKLSGDPDLTVYIEKGGTIGTIPNEISETVNTTGFKVSSQGLLTAVNAVISGTIYASEGVFTGTVEANSGKIGSWSITNNALRGVGEAVEKWCYPTFVTTYKNFEIQALDKFQQYCFSRVKNTETFELGTCFYYKLVKIDFEYGATTYSFFGTKELVDSNSNFNQDYTVFYNAKVKYYNGSLIYNTTNTNLPQLLNQDSDSTNLAIIKKSVSETIKRPVLVVNDNNNNIIKCFWLSAQIPDGTVRVAGDIYITGSVYYPYGSFVEIPLGTLQDIGFDVNKLVDFADATKDEPYRYLDVTFSNNQLSYRGDDNLLLDYTVLDEDNEQRYTHLNPAIINMSTPILSIGTPEKNNIPDYENSKIKLFGNGKIVSQEIQTNSIIALEAKGKSIEFTNDIVQFKNGNIQMFFPENKDTASIENKRFDDQYHIIIETCDKGDNYPSGLYFGAPPSIGKSQNTFIRGKSIYLYTGDNQVMPSGQSGTPTNNGAVYLQRSGGVAVTSDENQKDIKNITQNYENFFNNLNPILYNYKGRNRIHLGFGARAVEQALINANLTTQDFAGILKDESDTTNSLIDDGYLYSLRYEEFIALNTYMIKKALNKIQDLEAELEILKREKGGIQL